MPVCVGDDLHFRMLGDRFLEAVDAIDHRLNGRIVDDGDLALVSENLGHELARLHAAGEIIGADMRRHRRAISGNVDGDHLDAGFFRLCDGGAYALAVDRRNDDHINALDDEVLDVGELLVEVLIGDRHLERDVLLLGFGFHRLGELDVERVLLGQERCADAVGEGAGRQQCERGAGDESFENAGHVHGFLPWKRRAFNVCNQAGRPSRP